MWRLWAAGKASLEELETHWSLIDVLKANDVLDALDDAKAEAWERK